MSIVLQYDPRAHVTYAYHNVSTWDKETKKEGANRTLIGKIDEESGEIIKTSGKRRKKPIDEEVIAAEIEKFNNMVREKRKLESAVRGDMGSELQEIKEQYKALNRKYDEIIMIMRIIAESISQRLPNDHR